MATLGLLRLAALAVCVWSCFEVYCDVLDTNVCALLSKSDTITINSDGCDCDVYYYNIAVLSFEDLGTQITCSKDEADQVTDYSYDTDTDYSNYNCGYRDTDTDIAGSYPAMCSSDSDCYSDNGIYYSCECALDGNSYCNPEINSSLYDDFWTACESYDGDEVAYWIFYKYIYPIQVNAPTCASDIVWELMNLSFLDDNRNSGRGLSLLGIGALVVLI